METETKEELRERIRILEVNLERCWLCGDKKITMHHTKPGDNNSTIPLCDKHHVLIEGLKDLAKIGEGKKKFSYMEFNKFLKNYKTLKDLGLSLKGNKIFHDEEYVLKRELKAEAVKEVLELRKHDSNNPIRLLTAEGYIMWKNNLKEDDLK